MATETTPILITGEEEQTTRRNCPRGTGCCGCPTTVVLTWFIGMVYVQGMQETKKSEHPHVYLTLLTLVTIGVIGSIWYYDDVVATN